MFNLGVNFYSNKPFYRLNRNFKFPKRVSKLYSEKTKLGEF